MMKKIGKYFLLFIFLFCCYEFVFWGINYGDPMSHYGFSHALVSGEIPYVDFNIITTPLYTFYEALGLIFWDNFTMFLLEHCLLVTIMFYLLEKIYGKNSYLLLLVSFIFCFQSFLQTYNYFTFFLIIVLIYLEHFYKDKDYLIGFFIGLSILAKHTVGFFLVIPSLIFYYKDINKLKKRFIGLIMPLIVFIFYLLKNKAFYKFIDLCFLGLFDFSSKNGHIFNFYFFVSIITLLLSILLLIKNKKDIKYYYLIFAFMFVIPIFDKSHYSIYVLSFVVMLLPYLKIKNKYNYAIYLIIGFISFSYFIGNLSYGIGAKPIFAKEFKHFEFTPITKKVALEYKNTNKLYDSYKNPLIISYYNMHYDITHGNKIDYFDVFLNGNFGYKGTDKMIKKIESMSNKTIIIDKKGYEDDSAESQFAKEIVDYIIKNYKKIDEKGRFLIYYKK